MLNELLHQMLREMLRSFDLRFNKRRVLAAYKPVVYNKRVLVNHLLHEVNPE